MARIASVAHAPPEGNDSAVPLMVTLTEFDQTRTGCVTLDAFLTACARAGLTIKPGEASSRVAAHFTSMLLHLRRKHTNAGTMFGATFCGPCIQHSHDLTLLNPADELDILRKAGTIRRPYAAAPELVEFTTITGLC